MTFEVTLEGISIGLLQIRFYSLLILSGIGLGVIVAKSQARWYGENPDHVVNIAVIGAFCAILGARIYHVVDRDQWPYYSQNPLEMLKVWNGGIGIFGAIVGAAVGLIVYVWWVNRSTSRAPIVERTGLDVLRWFDIGAPAFIAGQAIGRWGNFFNQELYGPPTSLPWGIPIDRALRPAEHLDAAAFHPLFLYESLLSFVGLWFLLWASRRFIKWLIVGDVLLLYLIWYGAERFLLEFLRMDNWKFGTVPMAQIVAAVLIALAVAVMIWRHRRRTDGSSNQNSGQRAISRSSIRRRRRRVESSVNE